MTINKNDHTHDHWLSVFCPDEACLTEEEHHSIASSRATHAERGGAWLEVFCPEDSCLADTPTKVV